MQVTENHTPTINLSITTCPISCWKSLINSSCLSSVFLPDLNNAQSQNLQIDNYNHCLEGQKLMIELILLSLISIHVLTLARANWLALIHLIVKVGSRAEALTRWRGRARAGLSCTFV